MYSDTIFPVPILPIAHRTCKYEGMGMHRVDTLSVKLGRNIGELWQGKISYSEGFHQTARSPND